MVKKFQQEKVAKLLEEGNVYTMYMDTEDLSSAEPMDDGIGHRMMCWAGARWREAPTASSVGRTAVISAARIWKWTRQGAAI